MCPTPLPICNEYQIYDDNTCNCICKPLDLDEEDQYKCNEYEIFDIKTCDCKPLCDNISADSCHDKQYLDVDSCTCECKDFESYGSGFKAICGDNKIYNEQQCECVETEIEPVMSSVSKLVTADSNGCDIDVLFLVDCSCMYDGSRCDNSNRF